VPESQPITKQYVEVVDPMTGRRHPLTEASALEPLVSWGYGDTLLVQLVHPAGREAGREETLLACDAVGLACRTVATPEGDTRTVLPAG
jgi:hypothetical protein